jgi:hypothetical protein
MYVLFSSKTFVPNIFRSDKCHLYEWLETGFGSVIGFINHLQVETTTKYSTVTDFHTTDHSTLIFSVYFD